MLTWFRHRRARLTLLAPLGLALGCASLPAGEVMSLTPKAPQGLKLRVFVPAREYGLLGALPLAWSSAAITLNSPSALTQPLTATLPKPALGTDADGTPYADFVLPAAALRPAGDYSIDVTVKAGATAVAFGALRNQILAAGSQTITVPLYTIQTFSLAGLTDRLANIKTDKLGYVYLTKVGASANTNQVIRLDADGSNPKSFTLDGDPWGVTVDQDNQAFFTSQGGSTKLWRIQPDETVGSAELGGASTAVGVNNSVWVGRIDGAVKYVNRTNLSPQSGGTITTVPQDVEVSAGNVYVSCQNSNKIEKLNSSGVVQGAPFPLSFPAPRGMALDPVTGAMWAVSSSDYSILRFKGDGTSTVFPLPGVGCWVACDASGNAWVTLPALNEVVKLSPAGAPLMRIPVGANPSGVDVDDAGNVWVANRDSATVTKIRTSVPYGVELDGVDDVLKLPTIPSPPTNRFGVTGSFTVEAWARPTTTQENDPEATTGALAGQTGQRYLLYPQHGGGSPNAGAGLSMGTNGVSIYEHSSSYIPPLVVQPGTFDTWTHVAMVYSGNTPSVYVNGALARTGPTSAYTVFPGYDFGGGSYGYFQGRVGEIRVWSGARTPAQIQAGMFADLTGNEAGLLGLWKFREGAGATTRDYTPNNRPLTLGKGANGTGCVWIERGR